MPDNYSPQEEKLIDPKLLRQALGCFPTGVIIVTTVGDEGKPVGLTINSFSSVSLVPALVSWSIDLNAPSLGAFRKHQAFALNILGADQGELCMQFARPSDDKFANVKWAEGYKGVPVLEDALATFECSTFQTIEAGDHEMYLGKVKSMNNKIGAPLVFHRGQLAKLAS